MKKSLPILLSASLISGVVDAKPTMPQSAQKQIDAIQQAVDIVSSAQTKTGLSAVVQGASAPKAPKRKLTAKAKAKAVATIQSLKEILDPIVERAKR